MKIFSELLNLEVDQDSGNLIIQYNRKEICNQNVTNVIFIHSDVYHENE